MEIKPIKTETDYQAALKEIERLFAPDAGECGPEPLSYRVGDQTWQSNYKFTILNSPSPEEGTAGYRNRIYQSDPTR